MVVTWSAHGSIHMGAPVLFNDDFKLSLSVYVYDGVISV